MSFEGWAAEMVVTCHDFSLILSCTRIFDNFSWPHRTREGQTLILDFSIVFLHWKIYILFTVKFPENIQKTWQMLSTYFLTQWGLAV